MANETAFACRRWTTGQGIFVTPAGDEILNRELLSTGGWQRGLVEYLRDRCFPDGVGTFLDVGAHVGLVAIPIAKKHPRVTCHAFEPAPVNVVLLRHNIEENDVKNVVVHEAAASDQCGTAFLSIPDDNTVDHRVVTKDHEEPGTYLEERRRMVVVQCTTLNAALAGMELVAPVVVKMDVQGYEVHVLRGMTQVHPVPEVLVIEYWPYGLHRAGMSQHDLLVELSRYSHGAPLLGVDTIVRPGLHLDVVRSLPERSVNATEIICAGPR